MPQTHHFKDLDLHCYDNCIKPLESILNDHQARLKITQYSFDLASKTGAIIISDETSLSYQDNEQELRYLLRDKLPQENPESRKGAHALQALLGLLSGSAMMILMLLNVALPPWVHLSMIGLGSALTLFLGRKSFLNAYHSLKSKSLRFNMDSLFTLSSIAAITSTILHIFFPFFPPLIDAALMIFGFRHGGLWLEESFRQKQLKTKSFVDYGRESKILVSYQKNNIYEACTLNDIALRDIIKVPAGQMIPFNGLLTDMNSWVSFEINNGTDQAFPIHKENGKLLAGMVAKQDLIMEVTALEEGSDLRRRDLELINAQAQKPPIQELTNKIMQWFVPVVLTTAVIVGVAASYFLSLSMGLCAAFYWAVCACPCALGLITPIALKLGLSKFDKTGITFNKPKGLQAAANIDTVIFDLTGTLSQNKPQVIGKTVPDDYFNIISAIQARVLGDCKLKRKHPIANTLLIHLGQPREAIDFEVFEVADNGILAKHNGNVYRIGNSKFIQPPVHAENPHQAQQVIYFEKNGKVEGCFLLADPLRPGARSVLKSLMANHINCIVLTGADDKTADQFSNLLGFDRSKFITNQTPQSKADYIQALKRAGKKVAMIGDGDNDSNALGCANLSVAIGSPGSPLISEQMADASLHNPSLRPLLEIIPVGKQVMRVIKQNLAFSFAYNALSLGYVCCCLTFMPSMLIPFVGAGVMTLLSATVMFNTYRVLRQAESLPVVEPPTPQLVSGFPTKTYLGLGVGGNCSLRLSGSISSSASSSPSKDDREAADEVADKVREPRV